jgi:predicted alpha/beta hydrolase
LIINQQIAVDPVDRNASSSHFSGIFAQSMRTFWHCEFGMLAGQEISQQEESRMRVNRRTLVLGAAVAGVAAPWVARAAEPEFGSNSATSFRATIRSIRRWQKLASGSRRRPTGE